MSDFKVDASQLRRFSRSLAKAGVSYDKGAKRLLKEVGVRVSQLAKKYAPESPTMRDYANQNQDFVTTRSNSSITTGSLRDSIIYEVDKDSVSINVPANSKAGEYAEKIHEEKGRTWRNRGVRTVQKGRRADDKYIYRAMDDSASKIDELIDKVTADMIKGI